MNCILNLKLYKTLTFDVFAQEVCRARSENRSMFFIRKFFFDRFVEFEAIG